MLDPELARKILELPIGRELVVALAQEVDSLDKIFDIDLTGNQPYYAVIEIKARKLAKERLEGFLDPLINSEKRAIMPPLSKEYET